MIELSRTDFVRILGEGKVLRAEHLTEDEFQALKWSHLDELLQVYEKVIHTELFEARRAYITGLHPSMQLLLMRHVFDLEKAEAV